MLFALALVPFAAALACAMLPNSARNAVAWVAGLAALAGCGLLGLTAPLIFGGEVLRAAVPWFPGVAFGFRMDGLAWTFAGIIYAIESTFGIKFLESAQHKGEIRAVPPMILIGIVLGAFIGLVRHASECGLVLDTDAWTTAEQCVWEAVRS